MSVYKYTGPELLEDLGIDNFADFFERLRNEFSEEYEVFCHISDYERNIIAAVKNPETDNVVQIHLKFNGSYTNIEDHPEIEDMFETIRTHMRERERIDDINFGV